MSTISGKSMANGYTKAVGKGKTVSIGEDRGIKYIREADSTWMVIEFKPHLNLISDRLEKISLGAVSGAYSIVASEEDERLSDFGRKDDRFFMVPVQSILSGGLRFPLKDFFTGVLRELGIALTSLLLKAGGS